LKSPIVYSDPEQWLKDILSPDSETRHKAKMIIGGLEPSYTIDVAPFISNLQSENSDIAFWCVTALDRMGEHSSEAVPLLAQIAREHSVFGVRQVAIHALAKIAPRSSTSKEAIFCAFSDENSFVRREALSAAIKIPDLTDADLKKIKEMENDSDEEVSSWSEIALRNISYKKKKD